MTHPNSPNALDGCFGCGTETRNEDALCLGCRKAREIEGEEVRRGCADDLVAEVADRTDVWDSYERDCAQRE